MLHNRLPDIQFIEDIINGMNDWVRVLDRDNNIIFLNKSMAQGLQGCHIGEKCHIGIGRSVPCELCTSRKAVFDGQPHQKEETIQDRVYSVMSSPIRDRDGEIIAVVEVLRDITELKGLQRKILVQNHRFRNDLLMARKLQYSLLPEAWSSGGINFSLVYEPCDALGGDFFDIFRIDRSHIGAYIADVSGHGVPASMLTVFLHSSLNRDLLSPAQALSELYRGFNRNRFDTNFYITVFYAIFDTDRGVFTYSNAGHNVCPVVIRPDNYQVLMSPGVPISNWTDIPDYRDSEVKAASGDKLFLCTDGIVELRNPQNRQFGEERLLHSLLHLKDKPIDMLNRMKNEALAFAEIGHISEIPDDITMALVEVV